MKKQIKVESDLDVPAKLSNAKGERSYRKRQDPGDGSWENLLAQMNERMVTMERVFNELAPLLKEART